jgi:hypothetical protein
MQSQVEGAGESGEKRSTDINTSLRLAPAAL